MENKTYPRILKIVSIILVLMLFVNLTLVAMRKISNITFWIALLILFLINTFAIPRLKKALLNKS